MAEASPRKRWLWFVAYWIAGVATLGVVALVLRAVL